MSYNLLFVCTGNICRSAYAERYFNSKVEKLNLVSFYSSSAGTGINNKLRPPAEIISFAENKKVSIADHIPKSIDSAMISTSDLILTATVDHRSDLLRNAPSALNRVFTIKELAFIIQTYDPSSETFEQFVGLSLRQVAAKFSASRSLVSPYNLDIEDPYQQSLDVYQSSLTEVTNCIDVILDFLSNLSENYR